MKSMFSERYQIFISKMISGQKRKRGPFRFFSLSDFLDSSYEFVEVQSSVHEFIVGRASTKSPTTEVFF